MLKIVKTYPIHKIKFLYERIFNTNPYFMKGYYKRKDIIKERIRSKVSKTRKYFMVRIRNESFKKPGNILWLVPATIPALA
jgi:hypothetical protein